MAAGVYWKKANTVGATTGAIAGVGSWILLKLFTPENYPHNLIGFAVSCVTLVIVSLIADKKKRE
jgi:Na+/proline symporter